MRTIRKHVTLVAATALLAGGIQTVPVAAPRGFTSTTRAADEVRSLTEPELATITGGQMDVVTIIILSNDEVGGVAGATTIAVYLAGGTLGSPLVTTAVLTVSGLAVVGGSLDLTNYLWNEVRPQVQAGLETFILANTSYFEPDPNSYVAFALDFHVSEANIISNEEWDLMQAEEISSLYCQAMGCWCGPEQPNYPCGDGLWCTDDGVCADTEIIP
jgi:hypothetical protein